MFVSGLSSSEFVLLPGVQVLGIVHSTVVHMEEELEFSDVSRVLKSATRNQSHIISLGLTRLQDNALKMGATGVIGVKIRHQPLEKNISEYTLTGTAVAQDAVEPQAKPFVCTLSGQDYRLLISSGYRPLGVAFGVSVYSQKLHQRVQQEVEHGLNTERSDFTRGLYTARKHAFDALHQEANNLNSDGVLAINISMDRTLHRHSGSSDGMVIKMIAMGTAVVSCPKSDINMSYTLPLAD